MLRRLDWYRVTDVLEDPTAFKVSVDKLYIHVTINRNIFLFK